MSLLFITCLELLQFFPRYLIKLISNNAITFNNVYATIFICPSVRPVTSYNKREKLQPYCAFLLILHVLLSASLMLGLDRGEAPKTGGHGEKSVIYLWIKNIAYK